METEYQRIRGILEEQFSAALERRDSAAAQFRQVSNDIPSGLPHPDGSLGIANASAAYSAALRDVSRAVQRIADFQIRGIVPQDLQPEDSQTNEELRKTAP